jgi:hypothetical protein
MKWLSRRCHHFFRRENIFSTISDPQATEHPGLFSFVAVERYQPVSRIIVCGAIAQKRKQFLLFNDSEVKLDQHYYIKHVLQDHLLQQAQNID